MKVKKPFQVAEGEKYADGPVEGVAEILAGHGQDVRDKREPAGDLPDAGPLNCSRHRRTTAFAGPTGQTITISC